MRVCGKMPCECGSWDPSKQCGKLQCKCSTLAISVVWCSVAPEMAVWLKVQCGGCWHSPVCLLPSQRVTARQEEEEKGEVEE